MRRISSPPGIEHRIADLATAQHGPITRAQLLELGLHGSAIDRRVVTGRLHTLYDGVYVPGHRALGRHGRAMAAVLACGPGAVLSHGSAAHLYGMLHVDRSAVDVSVRSRSDRHRAAPGIELHRPRTLLEDETTVVDAIPITTAARTLLDVAEVVSRRRLERACDEAERARLIDWQHVRALIEIHPHKLGAKRLRRLMAEYAIGEDTSKSELERLLREFCDRHRLAAPSMNVSLLGLEIDFCWPDHGVIVETDGWEVHGARLRFEADRRRDAALVVAGWRVVRITKARLLYDAPTLARELRALLRAPVG